MEKKKKKINLVPLGIIRNFSSMVSWLCCGFGQHSLLQQNTQSAFPQKQCSMLLLGGNECVL